MSGDLFAAPHAGVARVALPIPVDATFDYAVPPALAEAVAVGCRVRVPFERRQLTGVIVALDSRPAPEAADRLRPLAQVLDATPALSPSLLGILRDEAAAVLCPVGLALHAALPPGSAPRSTAAWALLPRGREALRQGALGPGPRALLERLEAGPVAESALARGDAGSVASLRRLGAERLVVRTQLESGPRARPGRIRVARLAPGVEAETAADGPLARAPRQAALLRRLAELGPTPTAVLADGDAGVGAALRALARRGLVRVEEQERLVPDAGALPERDTAPPLTPEQTRACQALGRAIAARRADAFLLQGVTGSGKTEVYLRAVSDALALGRQALVLVPEITLTHQIVARLRARFGDALAVLHSGLKPGDRLAQWERLRRGETPIAVGARSALFAPLDELGVIVLDEEHDGAFKSEEGFRYHARRLAERRATAARCPLVLGSATPALETRRAADEGRLQRLVLPHRIGGRPLPAVELVDLARERARLPRGRKLVLSAPLLRAMREALADGGQTLLFLNRRGFSTQIACFACGFVSRCKHCDIALVFHAGQGRLRCHYCDFAAPPPELCPECGARENALLGIGTERLEEEVRAAFPEARVARLDRDTAARRGTTESILDALREGRVDVVVGTQILAKGHDFPGVRVVGAVNADLGLHFPDFRAAERSFQLLTQVAGRAGRGNAPGRVVVQTHVPEHYALRAVVGHDYEGFYAEELTHRRALGYPPFGHLAHVLTSGPDEARTRRAAEDLAAAARHAAATGSVEVLGPAPAPLARLRDRFRFQVLVKGSEAATVERAGRAAHGAATKLAAPLRASVDLDPYDML